MARETDDQPGERKWRKAVASRPAGGSLRQKLVADPDVPEGSSGYVRARPTPKRLQEKEHGKKILSDVLPDSGIDRVFETVADERRRKVGAYFDRHGISQATAGSEELDKAERFFVLTEIAAQLTKTPKVATALTRSKQRYNELLAEQLAADTKKDYTHTHAAHGIINGQREGDGDGIGDLIKKLVPARDPKRLSPKFSNIVSDAMNKVVVHARRLNGDREPDFESETYRNFEAEHIRYALMQVVNTAIPFDQSDLRTAKQDYADALGDFIRYEKDKRGAVSAAPFGSSQALGVIDEVEKSIARDLGTSKPAAKR
jgi:hypothetical protein